MEDNSPRVKPSKGLFSRRVNVGKKELEMVFRLKNEPGRGRIGPIS